MSIFRRKTPPAACPKCGNAEGWNCLPAEPPANEVTAASAVNPFAPGPIRASFGQSMTRTAGKSKKLRFHCDQCGYEEVY